MYSKNVRLVRSLLTVGLITFIAANAFAQDDPCERGADTHSLTIKVKHGAATEVWKGEKKKDELHVCRGDTIEWKLRGKNISITFSGASPLDDSSVIRSNGKFEAVVSDDAARETDYSYDITIDDEVTDPVIVVD